jgi:hypothetical protein
MQDLEKVIRERAYHLWVEGGCEHGNAENHWLDAQREILRASLGAIASVTVGKKSAKAKAPRKKRAA